ncbi:MAG: hypothetical protein Q9220_007624 [cf. Caloplaca sp. 1 TL-2023]
MEATPKLIRTFSDKISEDDPGDILNRGLATPVATDRYSERRVAELRDQWNLFLIEGQEIAVEFAPEEEAVLLQQSRKLYAAWQKFCHRLPESQRVDENSVPSITTLFRSVEEASQTWQDERKSRRLGKLKQIFTTLCSCFKDHSNLLSIVPTNDKYICLLTGSLSTIASVRRAFCNGVNLPFISASKFGSFPNLDQASTNHQAIADAVADSIDGLGQDIAYWNVLIKGSQDSKAVCRYVRELYVVVFEFLTEIFTNWSRSSWKR